MKALMYFNYTSRSLLRGGQRTVLAVFCVAVGVMAIVSLQLAGFMLQSSFTSNIRDTNGGDISVTAQSIPFKQSDLSFFKQLQQKGTITSYTAMTSAKGALSATAPSSQSFTVEAVNPTNFPLVTPPNFVTPNNGQVSTLLTDKQAVVTQSLLDTYQRHVGDTLTVYVKTGTGAGLTLHEKIVGVVTNSGLFAQSGSLLLVSQHDYQAVAPASAIFYNNIDINTANQAHTNTAVKAITAHFPLVSTQTVADALKDVQSSLDTINNFLEITGLLALLIGGVGIVNTMQVLLSRRKTEIAMLKTTGYRRMDLYLLFGLEAGLLGLIGGIVGAGAATGVSYIVRNLMQNLGMNVPFTLNPTIIIGGVAVGCMTALIFGLMPIVQAANVRPLNVIRDYATGRGMGSVALTIFLLVVLSVLFCALAIVILNNNVLLGIEAVYGIFAFLLLLSGFFSLIVLVTSKLPVPEHFNLLHIALIAVGVAASALVYQINVTFGLLMFVVALAGIAIVLLPRTWKVSTKMALRNIGRQRTRTTTTIIALFIGIFTIGLVLTLGQNLQAQLSTVFAQKLNYNVIATTYGADTTALRAKLHTVPGLTNSRIDTMTQTVPVAINGQPLQKALPNGNDRQVVIAFLSSTEGYTLSQATPSVTIAEGRNLNAADAGTENVLISDQLTDAGVFHMHLKVGDTLTFASTDGKTIKIVTVVGVYNGGKAGLNAQGGVLASTQLVTTLSPTSTGSATVTYMKIDPTQVNNALNMLGKAVPNANITNLADIGAYFAQQLNGLLSILVAIASLSVIASVIIIANAVALAMLERRRELGILKSVGYTSSMILSEVLIENGIVGTVGAFVAMALATAAVLLLGSLLFNLTFTTPVIIVVGLIGGSALLAMLTAALVAWAAVRIRPLEVLRYE